MSNPRRRLCKLIEQSALKVRQVHKGANLGHLNSSEWARQLFIPHSGHVMVGVDLHSLELRSAGTYLAAYDDDGNFAST